MPKPYPEEFRGDVARVARNRGPDVTLEQVAADFGFHAVTDPHVAAESIGRVRCVSRADRWVELGDKAMRLGVDVLAPRLPSPARGRPAPGACRR